jgi:hypothetical protein
MKKGTFLVMILCSVLTYSNTQAQLLKKLKDKVNQAANKVLDKKVDSTINAAAGLPADGEGSSGNGTGPNGKPVNKGGAGLKNTPPPDVAEQIKEAETANTAGNFSDARYAIQQALIGVELQIGKEILKSLPTSVNSLPADTLQDKLVSTQWGWNNLTILRVYTDGKDKEATISIGNNLMYSSLAYLYFNNTYMQANMNDQNIKQIKVKGNKAIIQYDDSKGYTLIVPLGQSSMIVWECVNYTDETEVTNTAAAFDIDGLKKMLGEQ